MRQAIDAKDWDTVGKAVSENGAAWNLGHIDTFTQGVVGGVVELKGPLKIFASVRSSSNATGCCPLLSEDSVELRLPAGPSLATRC